MKHFTLFLLANISVSATAMNSVMDSSDVAKPEYIRLGVKKPFQAWVRDTYASFKDNAPDVKVKGYANYSHVGGHYNLRNGNRLGAYATYIKNNTGHRQFFKGQQLNIRTRGHDYGITPYTNIQCGDYVNFFASFSYFEGKNRMNRTVYNPNGSSGVGNSGAGYNSRQMTSAFFVYLLTQPAKYIFTQFEIGHFQTSDRTKPFSILTTSGAGPSLERKRTTIVGDFVTIAKTYYARHPYFTPFIEVGVDMYTNKVNYFNSDDTSFKRNIWGYLYGAGIRAHSIKKDWGGSLSVRQRRGHTKIRSNEATLEFNFKF